MYQFRIEKFLILWPLFLVNICWAIPLDQTSESTYSGLNQIKMLAAKNAFDIGFLNLSEQLYRELFEIEKDPFIKEEIGIQLASVLINKGQYEEAKIILDNFPEQKSSEIQLLQAIVLIRIDPDSSKRILEQINPKMLSFGYQPWLYIVKGILAQNNQNFRDAKNAFLEARELAKFEHLKAHIDMLLFQSEIFSGKASEVLEKNLLKKIEKNKNATTLQQYAIVLDQLGKKAEAIDILESLLESLSSKEKTEIDSIILLLAFITGLESEKGRYYLEKIVERKQNLDLAKIALSILINQINTSNIQNYISFLTKLINNSQQHPLIDTLLIQRAQLALFSNQYDIAQSDAIRIIEEYPASIHNSEATKTLAYIAWVDNPPRYRIAAGILSKLAENTKDTTEQAELNKIVADSYFLNQDYINAARIYASLLQDPSHTIPKGILIYQLTLCSINQGNLSAAKKILDKFNNDLSIDPIDLWKAEWNLINSMKKRGKNKDAFTRIHELLQAPPVSSIPDDLKLRLLWLNAELSFEFGKQKETQMILNSLLELLSSSNINPEQKTLITSHALLLNAQSLLGLNEEEKFLTTIKELRDIYPETKAAILSYIIEARYYASINNSTKAQQQLIGLSDNYPNSEYAAIALYEAALNAESRGLKNTYQEALGILERLSLAYPNSPLAYDARFKQGDILRKLGDFSNAQLLYENLLKQNPDNSKKFQCLLALTDCLLAEGLNNNAVLPEIASKYIQIFESVHASTNLRAEAGFKAGFSFIKGAYNERAQEILWLTITNLLIDMDLNKTLNDQGRYWIARSIFELGNLLEKEGTTKEANEIYHLILSYNLPGIALANSKIR